jgi:hypothetical protein
VLYCVFLFLYFVQTILFLNFDIETDRINFTIFIKYYFFQLFVFISNIMIMVVYLNLNIHDMDKYTYYEVKSQILFIHMFQFLIYSILVKQD